MAKELLMYLLSDDLVFTHGERGRLQVMMAHTQLVICRCRAWRHILWIHLIDYEVIRAIIL